MTKRWPFFIVQNKEVKTMSRVKATENIGLEQKKKKSKIGLIFLFLLMFFVIPLVSLSVGTQFIAYKLQYHSTLGPNIEHIYAPWQGLIWFSSWREAAQPELLEIMQKGLTYSLFTFSMLFLVIVAIKRFSGLNKLSAVSNLHGSARWAEQKDIEEASLFSEEGVIVGAYRDPKTNEKIYLRHNGPEHIMTFAPTRSGKGVGLIIPTLLEWPHSVFITDLKGELWELTAGWRKKYANNKCIKFEPASLGSAMWNPLDEIRINTEYEVGDTQNLAMLIVDPKGEGLKDHWAKTAFALMTGCIMHLLYKREKENTPANMSALDAMLADSSRPIAELWQEMVSYPHTAEGPHPTVTRAAQDMLDRPEDEGGSVLSTVKSYLSLYRDPVVAKNTEASNFSVTDLVNHDSPVSLYLVFPPSDKSRLNPLFRILIDMTIRKLTAKIDFENDESGARRAKSPHKHRLLFVLDEMPSFGKLEIIPDALSYMAGYGLKGFLICQDITQLRNPQTGYGHDETITSNCHIKNCYQPTRDETAEYISKMTGETTVVKESITRSGTGGSLKNVSKTFNEVKRNLLTPDEVKNMPGPVKEGNNIVKAGEMLIFVSQRPAIRGEQPLYFQDKKFAKRSTVPPPDISDVIRNIVSSSDIEISL